ncbi:MAG: recombinase RecA [Clostridiales bacterium]|jgi:recombination protein RecA|nr:recombinase RecA [Clostridiales bacterium]
MAAKAEKAEKKEVTAVLTDRQKALRTAIADIEKTYGKGSVMKFGDKIELNNVDVVPTGALSIDIALGIGGIPRGRVIEIYGPESSGKTTITLHCIAQVQKLGGVAAFIDAEHALDPVYAKNLGVNLDELYISQPDNGEQALEIAEAMVRSAAIDIVVIDSVAALVPKAEIEGAMGASHMGLQARLMSQALRKMTGFVSRYNCIVIFTNQLRDKIGGMPSFGGPNETTTGGRALKFYASVRLDIRKMEAIKNGADIIGSRTKLKVAKNKLAPPFKITEFDVIFGEGVSKSGDLLDQALALGMASKSGSWFAYGDTRLGQGRENAKAYIKQNPDVAAEIEEKIRAHYGFKRVEALTRAEPAPEPAKEERAPKKKSAKKEDELELEFDEDYLPGLELDPEEEAEL